MRNAEKPSVVFSNNIIADSIFKMRLKFCHWIADEVFMWVIIWDRSVLSVRMSCYEEPKVTILNSNFVFSKAIPLEDNRFYKSEDVTL